MKYYLIEVTTMKDETISQAIQAKETLDKAIMDFHSSLASAMANENTQHAMRMIVDENGMVMRQENQAIPEPPTTPEDIFKEEAG